MHKSLAIRAYTLAANIVITSDQTDLDFKQIKGSLLELLQPREMRVYLPEVLGTLTGCKHFAELVKID